MSRSTDIALTALLLATAASGCSLLAPFDRDCGPGADGDADPDADAEAEACIPHSAAILQNGLRETSCWLLTDPHLEEVVVDRRWDLDTDACREAPEDGQSACTLAYPYMHAPGHGTCVVVVGGLRVERGASIRVTGSRGLLLLSAGDVVVEGTIDVGADGDVPGPGGFPPGTMDVEAGGPEDAPPPDGSICDSGGAAGANASSAGQPSGGGGGGGSSGPGASGGCGGGAGGGTCGVCENAPLMGGGGGGAGSRSLCDTTPVGGAGGGALLLFSLTSIVVGEEGSILAHGGNGQDGTCTLHGGGGGGGGGTIKLEGAAVRILGEVSADGGGGGDGGGDAAPPVAGGEGGSAEAEAGRGACTTPGATGYGGGGGGGAGWVYVRAHWISLDRARRISPRREGCLELEMGCIDGLD